MPKFVLFSAHAESIFPIMKAFEYFLPAELLYQSNPSSMFFVNFFECKSCCDGENYIVEVNFYPKDADKDIDYKEHIVTMSTRKFILFLENYSIDGYIKKYNIATTDVSQLCKEDYTKE